MMINAKRMTVSDNTDTELFYQLSQQENMFEWQKFTVIFLQLCVSNIIKVKCRIFNGHSHMKVNKPVLAG